MSFAFFLLLLLFGGGRVAAQYIWARPVFDFPIIDKGENDSVLYVVSVLPIHGTLQNNDSVIVPGENVFDNTSLLTYVSTVPYVFSVISGGACAGDEEAYDIFELTVKHLIAANGSSTDFIGMVESQENVTICLVDVQDLPITPASRRVLASNASTVVFNLSVIDYDDRVGLIDGLLSTFSFHEEDGVTVATDAGIVFNETVIDVGELRQADCTGVALTPGVKYEAVEFCFVYDPADTFGLDYIGYYATDKAGGIGPNSTLSFNVRDLVVCNDDTGVFDSELDCTARGYENSVFANTSGEFVNVTFPVMPISPYPFPFKIRVESLPHSGLLYYENETTLVAAGDLMDPWTLLKYMSQNDYFNRLYFPDYAGGYATFNNTDGTPVTEACDLIERIDGRCMEFMTYRALATTGDNTTSELGRLDIIVDRVVVETIAACPVYLLSPWAEEACISYGNTGIIIPIFLAGIDGRRDPQYILVITSLPTWGTLYYSAGNSTTYELGEPIEIGDELPAIDDYLPNLLYVANGSYFNRYGYDTSPRFTVSLVDDLGNYIGTCGPAKNASEDLDCTEMFGYRVVSGLNATNESPESFYKIIVAKVVDTFLTACAVDAYSETGVACMAQGLESNDLGSEGDFAIAIYLNANNSNGDAIVYNITALPSVGDVFINNGSDGGLEVGNVVSLYDVIPARDDGLPDVVYYGNLNYFNYIYSNDTDDNIYVDLHGVPLITCVDASFRGCPDFLSYQAMTAPGITPKRVSNEGRYEVFVQARASNIVLTGPYSILFTSGERFYFKNSSKIVYNDPDFDSAYVVLQLDLDEGMVGTNASLDGLFFPSENTCFNTTGCEDFVIFYAPPSNIKRVLDNLFFIFDEDINSTDNEMLLITITKKLPYGAIRENAFVNRDDFIDENGTTQIQDMVFTWDLRYFSIQQEYEDYFEDGYEYFIEEEEEIEEEKATLTDYITWGIYGFAGFVLVALVIYLCCQEYKMRKLKQELEESQRRRHHRRHHRRQPQQPNDPKTKQQPLSDSMRFRQKATASATETTASATTATVLPAERFRMV